jgi:hypothetical protein
MQLAVPAQRGVDSLRVRAEVPRGGEEPSALPPETSRSAWEKKRWVGLSPTGGHTFDIAQVQRS